MPVALAVAGLAVGAGAEVPGAAVAEVAATVKRPV